MEKHHDHGLGNHSDDEHIHMPSPSLSPIVLALGISCIGFAVAPTIFRLPFAVLGLLLTGYGLYTWIYDEIRNASTVEESE
jgi:hypothetical protein